MKNVGDSEFTWYSLMIILTFNIMDTVGRKAGGMVTVSTWLTISLSILRVGLIASTILIALSDDDDSRFIEKDTVKIINMVVFAFSNGFVSTLCAIKAPQYVPEDQREQVGIFVGLSIATGIVIGSLIAIPTGN